jgi:FtsZ-interacting cell division protein YlmF
LSERWRASGNSYFTAAEEADNASQESAAAEEADNTRQESSAAEEADNTRQESSVAEEADNTRQESSAAEEADYEIVENSAAANLVGDLDRFMVEGAGSSTIAVEQRGAADTPHINI